MRVVFITVLHIYMPACVLLCAVCRFCAFNFSCILYLPARDTASMLYLRLSELNFPVNNIHCGAFSEVDGETDTVGNHHWMAFFPSVLFFTAPAQATTFLFNCKTSCPHSVIMTTTVAKMAEIAYKGCKKPN